MAVISKCETRLPNGKNFVRVVKYDREKVISRSRSSVGTFYVELPEEVFEWNQKKNERRHSEADAIRAFDEKIEQFYNSKTTEGKFIILSVTMNSPEIFFGMSANRGKELSLRLSWGVYKRTDVAGRIKYSFIKGIDCLSPNEKHSDPKEEPTYFEGTIIRRIEWSEEREKWFVNLENSFSGLIKKIGLFMTDFDNQKLGTLIDAGGSNFISNKN